MWFLPSYKETCNKPVATELIAWIVTCFWICALTWLFSVTLCMCKHSEWERCREQRDESTRHSGDIQHWDTEMLQWPTGFDGRRVEWMKVREQNSIFFCPWSVKGLSKCVGVLNCGCWIKCVVAWCGFCGWVSLCFCLSSLNLSCEGSQHNNLLADADLYKSSQVPVSQSASAWIYFWTKVEVLF